MFKSPARKLSPKQARILDLLTTEGESYGLELVRLSEGDLKRGTIYVTLDRMEDRGLVESWETAPPAGHRGPPRRKYRATGAGEAALASWYESIASGFGGLKLASLFVLAAPVSVSLPIIIIAVSFVMTIWALTAFLSSVLRNRALERQVRTRHLVNDYLKRSISSKGKPHPPGSDLDRIQQEIFDEVVREWEVETIASDSREVSASQSKRLLTALYTAAAESLNNRKAKRIGRNPMIASVPASGLMRVLKAVLPRKFVKRRIEQTYADELAEYYEDLDAGRTRRALWVSFRVYVLVSVVIAVSVPRGLAEHVVREISGAFKSAS